MLRLEDDVNECVSRSSVHGILQTGILEWVAIPFSRGCSQPRDKIQVSHIAGRLSAIWAAREAIKSRRNSQGIIQWCNGFLVLKLLTCLTVKVLAIYLLNILGNTLISQIWKIKALAYFFLFYYLWQSTNFPPTSFHPFFHSNRSPEFLLGHGNQE